VTNESPPRSWRDSRLKRIEAACISAAGYRLVAGLGATLRWRTEGTQHYDRVLATGRQPIIACWHGRILPGTYFFRRRGIVAIASENFDGEWVAGILTRFGYGTARGSTSRGGRRALLQLTRDLANGKPAAFTVDGPRGPARVSQPGAIWLAKVSGQPILPFHIEADRHWTMRSWDRTQIPKPGAHVAVAMGEPLYVSENTDGEDLEGARAALDARLFGLEMRALAMLREG
jgi:lysophospholipid acyltransferase (LPLAT)-like uncharacterized protein